MVTSPLAGKIALVTGASRGIGRAISIRLAGAGVSVFALARDIAALEELAAEAGSIASAAPIAPISCDITDGAALDLALDRCGAATLLINNAGWAAPRTAIADSRRQDWQRTLATCLTAPMQITHTMLPQMLRQNSGAIVQILSPAAKRGRAGESAYAAAKAGLRGFTESLREETANTDILVSSIYPGFVDTDLIPKNRRVDRTRFLRPDDIATVVLDALQSPTHCCPTEIVVEPQRDPFS